MPVPVPNAGCRPLALDSPMRPRWSWLALVGALSCVALYCWSSLPTFNVAAHRGIALDRARPRSALGSLPPPFHRGRSHLRNSGPFEAPVWSQSKPLPPPLASISSLPMWLGISCLAVLLLPCVSALGRTLRHPSSPFHLLSSSQPKDSTMAWAVLASRGRVRRAAAASPTKPAMPVQVAPPVPTSLEGEITDSFLRYAMSVVLGRTLPDVRDGLKPVHRRILFALHDMGLTASTRYRKSAAVVGEVLGKYHPHGDTAVYDALVRMAQEFTMSEMLVDGQGNFGSVDADPPAAMRYTECRLRPLASSALLTDLSPGIVDFIPSYDCSRQEPTVLPARLPLLLINGSSGIAVGMATNIPPHNLGEVVDACTLLVRARITAAQAAAGLNIAGARPHVSDEELRKALPAPDFPTGGLIVGKEGVDQLYSSGSGSILMRAKVHTETVRVRGAKDEDQRQAIVVTELPYMMVKGKLVEQLLQDLDAGTFQGVESVRDESDREGIRVVIVVKRGASPTVVENNLLKRRLQTTYSACMIAINHTTVNTPSSSGWASASAKKGASHGSPAVVVRRPRPERLTLRGILDAWLDFRFECVLRRAKHNLERADAEAHLKDGFAAALQRLNDVVDVIRQSRDVAQARAALCCSVDQLDPSTGRPGHGLSRVQADSVLESPLSRLTAMQREKLEAQRKELHATIARLQKFIASDAAVYGEILDELHSLRAEFAHPRRTAILHVVGNVAEEELVQNAISVVTVTKHGIVRRMPLEGFQLTGKPGTVAAKSSSGRSTKADPDCVVQLLTCRDRDHLLAMTRDGMVHQSRAYHVPALDAGTKGKGVLLSTVYRLLGNAAVTCLLSLPKEAVSLQHEAGDLENKSDVGRLSEEERDDDEEEEEVEEESRKESPITCNNEKYVVLVTEQPTLKKLPFSHWEKWLTTRGRAAIRVMGASSKDAIHSAVICTDADDLLLVTAQGRAIRVAASFLKHRLLKSSMGKPAMALGQGDRLVDMVVLRAEKNHSEVALVTAHGMVKRLDVNLLRRARPSVSAYAVRAIKLLKGDHVAAVQPVMDNDQLLFVTASGVVLHNHCRSVPPHGRAAQGVMMKRRGGASDPIVGMAVVPAEEDLGESDTELTSPEEEVE